MVLGGGGGAPFAGRSHGSLCSSGPCLPGALNRPGSWGALIPAPTHSRSVGLTRGLEEPFLLGFWQAEEEIGREARTWHCWHEWDRGTCQADPQPQCLEEPESGMPKARPLLLRLSLGPDMMEKAPCSD